MKQCNKCNGKFEPPQNIIMTNCPFCKALLVDKINNNISPDSNEALILKIIQDSGEEIYTKKEFIGFILDYFPNNDFRRLMKLVIANKGAFYVYKLKQYSGNELQIKYIQIINKLSDDTFISIDILTPAVDLLCFGLGLKVQSLATHSYNFNIRASGVIPNSVTSIKRCAFEGHRDLTSITIPNSVTSIGESAFLSCTKLTSIIIPNSVTIIEPNAFENCISLESIIIPNSVTTINNSTFENCTSLTSVTLPNSVTSIGNSAFEGCTKLNSITLPNSVTLIKEHAFAFCTRLTSVIFPSSVKTIEEGAFEDCIKLDQVTKSNLSQLGYIF